MQHVSCATYGLSGVTKKHILEMTKGESWGERARNLRELKCPSVKWRNYEILTLKFLKKGKIFFVFNSI